MPRVRLRARWSRRLRERAKGPAAGLALLMTIAAGVGYAYAPVAALEVAIPASARPPAQPGLSWLSVSAERRIVDEQGRTVLLRGFNSDTLLEAGVRHAHLDETDANLMQRAGFDVVRLPIAWSRIEPTRGSIDTGYLDEVERTVVMLNRSHLYVVLDMHFVDWGPRFGGTGAPRWAALPLVPDLPWWPSEEWRKQLSPAQAAAYTYFWISPDWQSDFELVWRAVAARFRDDSGVVGYDIYNEPHPLPIPPRLFELHWMWPLYARTIEQIGHVDPNHLFVVEGVLFADVGTTIAQLDAPNVVYSPHFYTGSLVPPDFNGDRGSLDRRIDDQAREAAAVPAPMWPGELGIDHNKAYAAQWADAALDAYDDRGVGWAWWQWRESSGWGIRSQSGAYLDTSFLHHLARPYLAAAPTRVHAGRGDGVGGRITLRVDPGTGGDSVNLAWPELTLGPPAVIGATCVTTESWDAASARLSLTLGRAGCTILVTR